MMLMSRGANILVATAVTSPLQASPVQSLQNEERKEAQENKCKADFTTKTEP